jgi:hypothetical protein
MPRTLRATVLSGAALQQNPGDKKNHPHNSRNQGALPTKKTVVHSARNKANAAVAQQHAGVLKLKRHCY